MRVDSEIHLSAIEMSIQTLQLGLSVETKDSRNKDSLKKTHN